MLKKKNIILPKLYFKEKHSSLDLYQKRITKIANKIEGYRANTIKETNSSMKKRPIWSDGQDFVPKFC